MNSNLQPQYDIRYLFTGRIPPPSVSVGPDIRPFSRFLHRSQESFQALCSPDNRQALLLFVPFLQAPLLHLEESASFLFYQKLFRLYSDSGRFFQKSELFFILCRLSLSDQEASPDFSLYKESILQIRNQKALRHPSLLSWNPEQP